MGSFHFYWGKLLLLAAALPTAIESSALEPFRSASSIRDLVISEPSRHGIQTEWNTIHLAHYPPAFSAVVPLVPGKISLSESEAATEFQNFHHGKFFVDAPENSSVIAVVQVLHLPTVFGAPQTCQDFLQFTDLSNESDSTRQICGAVEPQDLSLSPAKLLGPRSFIAPSGKMSVDFLLFSTALTQMSSSPLTVELTFTASPKSDELMDEAGLLKTYAGICQFLDDGNDGGDEGGGENWLYCPGSNQCIHKNLFCDGLVNCPSNTGGPALDESSCANGSMSNSSGAPVNLHPMDLSWHPPSDEKPEGVQILTRAVQFIVVAVGAALILLVFVSFFNRLSSFTHCFQRQESSTSPSQITGKSGEVHEGDGIKDADPTAMIIAQLLLVANNAASHPHPSTTTTDYNGNGASTASRV